MTAISIEAKIRAQPGGCALFILPRWSILRANVTDAAQS
jgi:hypothetical protein